jgi:hypothetical protein
MKEKNEDLQLRQDNKLDKITQGVRALCLQGNANPLDLSRLDVAVNALVEFRSLQDDAWKTQTILEGLHFDMREVRHSSIHDAHRETFKWIFDSKFATWLRGDGGTFWIAGKAGSGKSTLMKFLVDHAKTIQLAKEWAAPHPVILASHYFWNPGTEMQRSQRGLLQSLLFEIFRQDPDLIRLACPKRWGDALQSRSRSRTSWSITELSACFKKISDQENHPVRFCLS